MHAASYGSLGVVCPVLPLARKHFASSNMSERSLHPVVPFPDVAGSLADRLRGERHRAFIGRKEETALLEATLANPRCALLFLTGQAGTGKTSTLLEYERLCLHSSAAVAYWDAAGAASLAWEDRKQLQGELTARLSEPARARSGSRPVLLVDSYERLGATEAWLLGHLVPELPSDTLLVFASRHAPPLRLSLDPAWGRLMQCHTLAPWSETEAREFLGMRGVQNADQTSLIELVSGYPLALAIGADIVQQGNVLHSQCLRELQGSLGQALLPTAVSRSQQLTLDVCALARNTTPELLEHVLLANPQSDFVEVQDLFAWLASQPFVQRDRAGLSPHFLARVALVARVCREHPQNYQAVYRPVREFCIERLAAGGGSESGFADLFFLDRDVPFVAELAQTNFAEPEPILEVAEAADRPVVAELIRALEGEQSAELAKLRLRDSLATFEVTRSSSVDGVMQVTVLSSHTEVQLADRDPAARLARQFVLEHPLANGAQALFFRWFLSRGDYQSPRARVLTLAARQAQVIMSNPRAVYSLCVFRAPEEWAPLWDSASVPRQVVGKFMLGPHEYTLMAFFYQDHSLRELLVDAWQELPPAAATQPPPAAPEPEDQVQKVRQRAAELGRTTKLTPREQQILELLCLGGSFEEIATELRIRPRTVKFHQENLLRKTGSSSRIELFRKLI